MRGNKLRALCTICMIILYYKPAGKCIAARSSDVVFVYTPDNSYRFRHLSRKTIDFFFIDFQSLTLRFRRASVFYTITYLKFAWAARPRNRDMKRWIKFDIIIETFYVNFVSHHNQALRCIIFLNDLFNHIWILRGSN